jgi:hypothetical protein
VDFLSHIRRLFQTTGPLKCSIFCLPLVSGFRLENRNQDRSQFKPVPYQNSNLLMDPWQFLYFTPTNPPPPPANIYREKKRDSYYTVVWEAAEKLMLLVWFFLGRGVGYRQMFATESVNRSLFRRRKGLHWLLSWFLFSASANAGMVLFSQTIWGLTWEK